MCFIYVFFLNFFPGFQQMELHLWRDQRLICPRGEAKAEVGRIHKPSKLSKLAGPTISYLE
jgi:hypothetical protein